MSVYSQNKVLFRSCAVYSAIATANGHYLVTFVTLYWAHSGTFCREQCSFCSQHLLLATNGIQSSCQMLMVSKLRVWLTAREWISDLWDVSGSPIPPWVAFGSNNGFRIRAVLQWVARGSVSGHNWFTQKLFYLNLVLRKNCFTQISSLSCNVDKLFNSFFSL